MAELEQVAAPRRRRQLVSSTLDRAVLGPCRSVDEHRRQTGSADRLDLGMVPVEADDDDSVDRCASHRSLERAVQRRDEQQPEAAILGHRRDAFGEEREERIGERLARGCGRQDADRRRRAGGQHARDRVRPVAERGRHLADAIGRLGPQPVGAVEGERNGRLAHPGLARDVGYSGPGVVLAH